MKYFIDTNIFLRALIGDVETQFVECVELLKQVKRNKIHACTASIILAEIVWTLQSYYEFPKDRAIQGLRSIINLRGLKIIDGYDHAYAIKMYEAKNIKYVDALISSIKNIQNKKIVVISYDKDFDKLPILKKEPSEIVKN